jgi:hypothetical protein
VRVFAIAVLAIIVIAAASAYVLTRSQNSVYQVFASQSNVRLSDEEAGHNLVGKEWYSAREH